MSTASPLVRVLGLQETLAKEQTESASLQDSQSQPVIAGIAAYVKTCWTAAYTAKIPHENDMLAALRMRSGEYDAGTLTEIRKQGGSEIYMRVGATKMRAAQSWLKDIFLTIERPFTIAPTPLPSLQEDQRQKVDAQLGAMIEQAAMRGVPPPTPEELEQIRTAAVNVSESIVHEEAKRRAERMETRIDDYLVEGGFYTALDECLADITTFKGCVMKGPVVRKKKVLKWEQDKTTQTWAPGITEELRYKFERVNPLLLYPAPHANGVSSRGYLIERHRMQRSDLSALIGVDGYDEIAIRECLKLYGTGGLRNWLSIDLAESAVTKQDSSLQDPEPWIEALEFWGGVQGSMLNEWAGREIVTDPDIDYAANVWVVGPYVIRATLNHDPLGRIPYAVTAWEKLPAGFWGTGLGEILTDVQQVCNASARALVNNMAIASGPQVSVNTSRIASGDDITQMYPWKIWQHKNDPFGSTEKPLEFFQPQSNAQELMAVFEKFSTIADEVSAIPRYMTGSSQNSGAARTASGLSMLMNAANKGIKSVANNIDTDLIIPTIERMFYFIMAYDPDNSDKGDVEVRARGASGLMLKELLNQRRLEFLQIVTPFIQGGLLPPTAIISIMSELAKGLEFPEGVIPTVEEFQQHMAQMEEQQAAAMEENAEVQRDENGAVTGVSVRQGRPKPDQSRPQALRNNFAGPKPGGNPRPVANEGR